MKILNNINQITNSRFGLSIGNFDGVHLGHQQLIKKIKKDCTKNGLEMAVMSFWPHPQKVINNQTQNFLIYPKEKKIELLSKLGIDYYIEINFNRDFSLLTPHEFLEKYIFLRDIHPLKLYLGHDFAFGGDKKGNTEHLLDFSKKFNCLLEQFDIFRLDEARVSSSFIRSLIKNGQMSKANQLLGRLFSISGNVVKCKGRGKTIGFPTANILINNDLIYPPNGVYITKTFVRNVVYTSVTNIGYNPTFENEKIINIETHILDFDFDIYGENIEISFVEKIRDEKKFSSVFDLISQINNDIVFTKNFITF